MAKIDVIAEIMRHTDDEIIELLNGHIAAAESVVRKAIKDGNPTLMYAMVGDLEMAWRIVNAINRRNQERKIQ